MIYISETDKIVSSEVLSKSVNTNSSHIRKIIGLLKKSGLVESNQGKLGFYLSRDASEITLAEIYESVYPEKKLLNIHEEPNLECPIGANIKQVLQPIFDKAEYAFLKELDKKTLKQLIEELYKKRKK